MPPRKIVFDSNIWVRYILTGQLEKLTKLILEHELVVYSSERLIAELEDVLSRPKFADYLTLPLKEYIDFHRQLTEVSLVNYEFRGSPDPKDDFLFDLGLSVSASHLITNDKPLLGLVQVRSLKVISMQEFLKVLGDVK